MNESKVMTICIIITVVMTSISAYLIYDNYLKEEMLDERTAAQTAIHSVVQIECSSEGYLPTAGTGFIIAQDGVKVLTNAHVIAYESSPDELTTYENITCKFFNSPDKYLLEVISYDIDSDLSVLKFADESINVNPLKLGNSGKLQYGQEAYTIGNGMNYGLSAAKGCISVPLVKVVSNGFERLVIQTDLYIHGGNSGGPLLNENNEVIGMMSFRITGSNGSIVQGISYAVPSNIIAEYLRGMPAESI